MIVPRVHHDRISSVGNGRLCDYFLGAGYVNVFCESIYSWIGTFSSFSRIDIVVCPDCFWSFANPFVFFGCAFVS